MILKGYIFAVLYALVCIAVSFVAYKLGMPKNYTRKLVHILVGFEWVILWHYVGSSYHFIIVCVFFLILLALSYFLKLMPMLSSDGDNAPGTVYYAVAMTVMAVISFFNAKMLLPFGIGVVCTSIGDGMAGVVGQLVTRHNPKIYKNKTLFGFLTNFAVSFGCTVAFSYIFDYKISVIECVAVGILSAGLELVTELGFDNITTTLGTAFLSYAFIYFESINSYIIPILLTPFVICVVNQREVLTKPALIVAIVLDVIVSVCLGNIGFVALLLFLLLGVVSDKIKKHRKAEDEITSRSSKTRDVIQVLANGFVPGVLAIMSFISRDNVFLVAYLASLAEALADTFASGFGVYSKTTFDLFKMRKCQQGISGGMSLIGTLASLVGATLIALVGLAFGKISWISMFVVIGTAFLGAVFDSFLGSVFQIKYKCSVCGIITEKEQHCDKKTQKHSGFSFFDNDVVNILSGVFASTLAVVVCLLLCP